MLEHSEKTRQVIEKIGGASRDRTDGLVVANDALSQLSYSPAPNGFLSAHFTSVPVAAPIVRHQLCLTNPPIPRLTL
jgi:hypothetical protein